MVKGYFYYTEGLFGPSPVMSTVHPDNRIERSPWDKIISPVYELPTEEIAMSLDQLMLKYPVDVE